MKYILKGPFGFYKGTKSEVQELAEIFPENSQIQSPPSKQWQTLTESHPHLYVSDWREQYHFWNAGGSQSNMWTKPRDLERRLGPWEYIGPHLLAGRFDFEEVIEQILRDVQAPHLISPVGHQTWQSWTHNKAIYQEVRKRTTEELPASDFHPRHRTLPGVDQQELRSKPNWDLLIEKALPALLNIAIEYSHQVIFPRKPFGMDENIFRNFRMILFETSFKTIVKAPRDNKRWSAFGPTSPYQVEYHTPIFSKTLSERVVLPVLKGLAQLIAKEFGQTGTFYFPNIGRLTVKETKLTKYVGVSGTSLLKKYINQETDIHTLPGEQMPMRGTAYWLARSRADSPKHATLSRQRQVSAQVAHHIGMSLTQVHGCLCFVQRLIYMTLRTQGECYIPHLGTFSTSDRRGRSVLRFKAHKDIKPWRK